MFVKIKSLPFVQELWLYGSRARGGDNERADIDLAVVCDSDCDWQKVLEIIEDADTLLEIDCVNFNKLKKNINKRKFKIITVVPLRIIYPGRGPGADSKRSRRSE